MFRFFKWAVITVFLALVLPGCDTQPIDVPTPSTPVQRIDTTRAEAAVESAFGQVERDKSGTIVAVNLALERSSATDDVLEQALEIPNLKRFRLAGGSISQNVFRKLSGQVELEDIFLQDVPVSDEDLVMVLSALPKLKRVTLRRLPNVSDQAVVELAAKSPWHNLALIDMNITGESVRAIMKRKTFRALDFRNCNRLVPEDYAGLVELPAMVDLKIGGFSVNDQALEAIAPLTALTGLTIEDAFVTPEGWKRFIENSQSAKSLETLVLNRCSSLLDDSVSMIVNFPKLKRLTVGDMMITGRFLNSLAEEESNRPKLQRLSLRKTLLTDEGAEALHKYPELCSLDISGTAMTLEIAKILLTLRSVEEIDVSGCCTFRKRIKHKS